MTSSEAKDHLDKELSISGLTRKQWYWDIYLKSPHWKDLRKQVFISQGKQCSKCPATKRLDVHHLQYKSIFDVLLEDLQVLCRPCHRKEHPEKRKTKKAKVVQTAVEGKGLKWEPILFQMMRNAKRKDPTLESRCIKKLIKRYRDKLSPSQAKMLQDKRNHLRKEHKKAVAQHKRCTPTIQQVGRKIQEVFHPNVSRSRRKRMAQEAADSLVWDLENQFFRKTLCERSPSEPLANQCSGCTPYRSSR